MYKGRTLIRLVIADDHELIREGVKRIIRPHADMKVVGEAADLKQVLALVAQVRPDVVVLDINLPDYEGLKGLAELRRHFPDLRIVILSMHEEEHYARAATRGGALGYVSKAMASAELVDAVRRAAEGMPWPGPGAPSPAGTDSDASPQPLPAHHALTPRELEILAMIGSGLQVKQVAGELGISISSVNTYRTRIFRKMGLSSNAALIRYALRNGLSG
jgi:DNA-binding NarL/FixJ family response regulator